MPRYPQGCTEEQKYHVQSFARTLAGFSFPEHTDYEWSKYFSRRNYDLAACEPIFRSMHRGEPVSKAEGEKLFLQLQRNAGRAASYLEFDR